MKWRVPKLLTKVRDIGYDAYLVTDAANVKYLTGLPNPQSPYLLVRAQAETIICLPSDGYATAKSLISGLCEIKTADVGQPTFDLLSEELPRMGLKRIGFDTLTADDYLKLVEGTRNTSFVPDRNTMWELRMIKSEEEIVAIRKAAKIADVGQKTAAEVIRPGIREYEVAAEVEYAMRILGSEDEGHRTVVASGSRTSTGSMGGYTTNREIGKDELVEVDTGATIDGYRTDLGRTYVAGKPTAKQKEIYKLVQKAWRAAFECVKPGALAEEIDAAARRAYGNEYEKYLIFEAGHGIGQTFEPPLLTKNNKAVLKENMVVTVEPGLSGIPGVGGFLIEDTTLVVKDGAERLTAPALDW